MIGQLSSTPAPLIIDTDPGVDDVLAILLALASKEVRIAAITITFGNTSLDHGRANVERTVQVLREHLDSPACSPAFRTRFEHVFGDGAARVPIALGKDGPLEAETFFASYFHGKDGLSGITTLPDNPFSVPDTLPVPFYRTKSNAVDQMLSILSSNPPYTVRIAALGPLTTLALAFKTSPSIFSRVHSISVMGGALDAPGNTTPCAEFNFYADPHAARYLLEEAPLHPEMEGKSLPIFLFPLDTTHQHTVPYGALDQPNREGKLFRYISAIIANPRKATNSFAAADAFDPTQHDNFVAHDPLAIAHAICGVDEQSYGLGPARLAKGWNSNIRRFRVECEGRLTRGFCVVDRRAHASIEEGADKAVQAKQGIETYSKAPAKVIDTNDAARTKARTDHQIVTGTPGREWFTSFMLDRLDLRQDE